MKVLAGVARSLKLRKRVDSDAALQLQSILGYPPVSSISLHQSWSNFLYLDIKHEELCASPSLENEQGFHHVYLLL